MKPRLIRSFESIDDKKEFDRINLYSNVKNATRILYFIIAFEVFMLGRLFITKVRPYPSYVVKYMLCYILLLAFSLLTLLIIAYSIRSKKDRTKLLSVVTTAYEIGIVLWSIEVSLLDSYYSEQFIVYITIVVCLASMLKLKPWLFLSIEIGGFVLITALMMYSLDHFNNSNIINLVVFTTIFVVISVTKYNNAVDEYYNKKKIRQLNDMLADEKSLYEKAAKTDQLTGLFNRNILKDDILKRVSKNYNCGSAIGIAMFDLDNFKIVNDTYGHAVGDECLIKLGDCFRKYPKLTVYRYGGEEFLAICDGVSEKEFITLIEGIIKDVSKFEFSAKELKVTISSGYTYKIPEDELCDEELIKTSDNALYKAKTNGKNCCVKG